jgi:hypothetical protein
MGSGVFADPRYAALASRAAAELGGGADLARAILAQFACEKANGWPPQDNNPGHVHVAAMASIGVTGLASGLGDSGACARFATPEAGTDAMVALLTRASRYAAAVTAARHNDGGGYLRGVTSAGWGTGYSCAAGYYGAGVAAAATSTPGVLPGTTPPSSPPPPSLGATSPPALNATQQTLAKLGIPTDPAHLLTDADIWKITMQALGQDPNSPINASNQIYQGYLANLRGKTVGQMAADYSSGTTYGAPDLFSGVAAAIAGLPAAIGAALGPLLIGGGILVVILLLAYKGVQGLVEA